MMNILYVWFPASWGPSVVEAIQTRNHTSLTGRKLPGARGPEKSPVGSRSGTSRQRASTLSWQQMQELTGLPWTMMTLQRSSPSCSRVYCRMCIRKGRPQRGKVPNRKNLRCQCSSQGPALRQNGEIYYNPDANSGLHLPLGMPLLSREC